MNLIESHLITKDNQFGFKKKHSTDLCIFTVKSVIKYYNLYNSPVYSCFLDASKAYDRVNHWELFKKLLKRSNSVIILRILMFWYSKQEICIKWGNETSTCLLLPMEYAKVVFCHPHCFLSTWMIFLLSYLKWNRLLY